MIRNYVQNCIFNNKASFKVFNFFEVKEIIYKLYKNVAGVADNIDNDGFCFLKKLLYNLRIFFQFAGWLLKCCFLFVFFRVLQKFQDRMKSMMLSLKLLTKSKQTFCFISKKFLTWIPYLAMEYLWPQKGNFLFFSVVFSMHICKSYKVSPSFERIQVQCTVTSIEFMFILNRILSQMTS